MKKTPFVLSILLVFSLVLAACSAAATPAATAIPTQPAAATTVVATDAAISAPATTSSSKLVFVMVTDQNGLGDQGFNDLSWSGMQKAGKDLNADTKIVESSEEAQYVPNLTTAANDKASLVVGVGSLLTDALEQVAKANPNTNFALIDSSVDATNVRSVVFRQQEGSFLGGVIAGLTTKTNKVGAVGGMEIPVVVSWISGFEAGVKAVNPKATVMVTYAGSFGDPAKGKEIATTEYDQGADVIFEVAGGTGVGAWQAASEHGKGVYIFGSDTCKYSLAPDNALPDVVKNVDTAIYDTAKDVANGSFAGGQQSLGLKENGVGLCDKTYQALPDSVKTIVEKAKQLIIDGTLVPPTTKDELDKFTSPDLSK